MYKKLEECPLCGENQLKYFKTCKDHSVSQQEFTIVECVRCHFRFTNPRPEDEQLGKFYESDEYISHNNHNKNLFTRVYQLARLFTVRNKVSLINNLNTQKSMLLDYGCGTGTFVAAAQANGWRATGIEPNDKARYEAGKNKNITFYAGLNQLDTGQLFEVITLWHVLEHVADLHQTIASLKNLLTDQGKMVIAVPNHEAYEEKIYGKHWAAYDVPRHLYHFSQSTMKALVAFHHLRIENILPMKLDALYVSLLSEKYMNNNIKNNFNPIIIYNALKNGLKSNRWARKNNNNYSSLIYVIAK